MENAWTQVGIELAGAVSGGLIVFGGMRVTLRFMGQQIAHLEKKVDEFPKEYVPRTEVQKALDYIHETTQDIKKLLHLALAKRAGVADFLHAGTDEGAPVNNLQYSAIGIALTEQEESLSLKTYLDSTGVLTIGWGHTGKDVRLGLVITRDQAVILLRADTAAAVACVNHAVRVPLTQNEFDGLVDFVFNEGAGHFLGSTLLAKLNAGDYAGAAAHFADWVKAGGKTLGGLVRRRGDEEQLFLRSGGEVAA